MKICYFNRYAYNVLTNASGPIGGAERAMANLARQTAISPSVGVSMVTQANDLHAPVVIDNIRVLPLHHIQKPLLGVSKRPDLLLKFLWDEFLAIVHAKPDVVCVSQAAIETMVVYLAARWLRIPVVYRLASSMELDYDVLKNVIFWGHASIAKLFESFLRRTDLVVAQTPEQAALFEKRFHRIAPVVCNMLTMPVVDVTETDIDSKQTILWVGRAHHMKRLEVFVELARRMPKYRFVAIAPETAGEADYYAKVRETAKDINNLQLIPGLPPEQICNEYAKARVSVMTSESEGFPNVMAEAMANGAPFLTTLLNPSSWLTPIATLDDAATAAPACGYYCQDNLECMAAMIERLMTNRTFCYASAGKAQEQVRAQMCPTVIAQKYYALFEQVVKR